MCYTIHRYTPDPTATLVSEQHITPMLPRRRFRFLLTSSLESASSPVPPPPAPALSLTLGFRDEEALAAAPPCVGKGRLPLVVFAM